ncbi:hypothetical protein N2152v2_000339 [Parachlorella kessleri]
MSSLHLRASSPVRLAASKYEAADGNDSESPHHDDEIAPLMVEIQQQPAEQEPPVDKLMTTLLFLFPAIGGLLFGYDIGATSGALVSLTSPQHSGTDWYSLNAFQSGLVVSLSLAGALLGSLVALLYGDRLGRKKELLAAAGLYASSSLLLPLASTLPTVLAARLIYGLGIGLAMHAAPAYIAETSPPRVRGLLISLKEAFIVGGILAGYAASYLFVEVDGGWRYMYGLAALPAALLGAGMVILPESPRWLLLSGAPPGAVSRALWRVKGAGASQHAVDAELSSMMEALVNSPKAQSEGTLDFKELCSERYRRPLAIGVSLMLFQQITGQPSVLYYAATIFQAAAVLYYAATIFQAAGFSGATEAAQVSLILGLFKLVMTCVAVATVDSWGRRPLLLLGVGGIVVSLLALGTVGSGALPLGASMAAWANLGALLLYVGCYQVSFGPISWLLVSFGPISWLLVGEVFPLKVRGQAIALATITNFASNFAVSLALPTVQQAVGQSATYFGFAGIGAVALLTIYNLVPETKGKTLEEIEALWRPEAAGNLPTRQESHAE